MATTNSSVVITGQELISLGNAIGGEQHVFESLAPANNPTCYNRWSYSSFTSTLILRTTPSIYSYQNNTANPSAGESFK